MASSWLVERGAPAITWKVICELKKG